MTSWAAFPGRWGQAVCTRGLKLCTRSEGPPTPTYQNRFTKPWTAVLPMTKSNERIYEYACQEGNYALPDILRGARYQEKQPTGR